MYCHLLDKLIGFKPVAHLSATQISARMTHKDSFACIFDKRKLFIIFLVFEYSPQLVFFITLNLSTENKDLGTCILNIESV